MLTWIVLLSVCSIIHAANHKKTCPVEFDWGTGIKGKVLRSFVLFSKDKPRMTSGRKLAESYAMCREECMNSEECTGVEITELNRPHLECFLMNGERYPQFDKMSIEMDCEPVADPPCYFALTEPNKSLTGNVIKKMELNAFAVGRGHMNVQYIYDVAKCREECLRDANCAGVTISDQRKETVFCNLVDDSGDTQHKTNWQSAVKYCIDKTLVFSNSSCEFGGQLTNMAMSGDVLRTFTTLPVRDLSSDYDETMTFDESIYKCEEECLRDELCSGIQITPTKFEHHKCQLMTGKVKSRRGWRVRVKHC